MQYKICQLQIPTLFEELSLQKAGMLLERVSSSEEITLVENLDIIKPPIGSCFVVASCNELSEFNDGYKTVDCIASKVIRIDSTRLLRYCTFRCQDDLGRKFKRSQLRLLGNEFTLIHYVCEEGDPAVDDKKNQTSNSKIIGKRVKQFLPEDILVLNRNNQKPLQKSDSDNNPNLEFTLNRLKKYRVLLQKIYNEKECFGRMKQNDILMSTKTLFETSQ